jgi:cytochrome c
MKTMLVALGLVGGLFLASAPVLAQEDLAKAKGCLGCHAVDQKKVGPAFKDVAAKYKDNKDAEATLVTKLSEGKGHMKVSATPDETKSLVKWVLSQK